MINTSFFTPFTLSLLSVIVLWDIVWKLLASWRAARNRQKVWFVLLIVLNTAGILPIVYLLMQPKKQSGTTV